jgi:hypothetical protein
MLPVSNWIGSLTDPASSTFTNLLRAPAAMLPSRVEDQPRLSISLSPRRIRPFARPMTVYMDIALRQDSHLSEQQGRKCIKIAAPHHPRMVPRCFDVGMLDVL